MLLQYELPKPIPAQNYFLSWSSSKIPLYYKVLSKKAWKTFWIFKKAAKTLSFFDSSFDAVKPTVSFYLYSLGTRI